ncbi:MAG: molybdenum cofactor guanylyltransferase MobA [Granulosicoccaceae bacterium]
MTDVGVVILAGGLARRMEGQDKGLVVLGDKPMVQWTLDIVKQFTADIVINANRNHDAYQLHGIPVISDQHKGHLGPLAGLYAAMQSLDNDYIIMCPCDSPFVQIALLNKLKDGLTRAATEDSAEIVVAHDGDRLQPVFAMVSGALADSLDNFLLSGERKIDKWYGMHKMLAVDCSDCAASFRNINTEEERLAAELEISQ